MNFALVFVTVVDYVYLQYERIGHLTSQKNSLPLNPQNQEIHDTSSELLIAEDLLKNEPQIKELTCLWVQNLNRLG